MFGLLWDLKPLFSFRYFLQPRENGGKSVKVEELGSLRLNIVYTEDHVFPSEHYTPLRDLLLHSANVGVRAHERFSALLQCLVLLTALQFTCLLLSVQPVSASTAHILGEVCREKQEAAIPLVRLFLHYGKIVPFISAIAHAEVNRTQWVPCCMKNTRNHSSTANTCHNSALQLYQLLHKFILPYCEHPVEWEEAEEDASDVRDFSILIPFNFTPKSGADVFLIHHILFIRDY